MNDLEQKITTLEEKIDKIYISTEKTRKYFLWTLIVTLCLTLFPLIGLLFAIPSFLGTFSEIQNLGL